MSSLFTQLLAAEVWTQAGWGLSPVPTKASCVTTASSLSFPTCRMGPIVIVCWCVCGEALHRADTQGPLARLGWACHQKMLTMACEHGGARLAGKNAPRAHLGRCMLQGNVSVESTLRPQENASNSTCNAGGQQGTWTWG